MLQESRATQSMPVVVAESTVDILAVVTECVEQAGGNFIAADKLLQDRMRADPTLYRAIINEMLSTVSWAIMRRYAHSERKTLWTAPNYDAKQKGERVEHLAAATYERLMLFPLPLHGMPRLGEATKEQVLAAVEFYRHLSEDTATKARWLELIANRLKGKRTVNQQLREADLVQLENQAKGN